MIPFCFQKPLPFMRLALLWIAIGMSVLTTGCLGSWPLQNQVLESEIAPAEMKQYLQAVNSYQAAHYETAAKQFAAIREQSANPVASRMALYGLACSRLMVAKSPDDYRQALALWDTWVQCATTKYDRENPTLFDPILEQKMVFSMIPLKEGEAVDLEDPSRWFMLRANNELQKLRYQLVSAQQDIDDRDKRIKALEKELARLNEQIKALETIDQKIQKKKNSIPSAD
jgi:hypothetical protein